MAWSSALIPSPEVAMGGAAGLAVAWALLTTACMAIGGSGSGPALGVLGLVFLAILTWGQGQPAPVRRPSTPPPPPPASLAPAWLADPHRRHELRWCDGTSWTEHVSTAGTAGVDPPDTPAHAVSAP